MNLAAKLCVTAFGVALAAGAARGQDAAPDAQSLRVARGILDGSIPDPTGGATAFYKPAAMPKEGERIPAGTDVAGGLELTPGVTEHGRPIRNYRPGWATRYQQVQVAGVNDRDFKFFRGAPELGALSSAFGRSGTAAQSAPLDPDDTPATPHGVDLAAAGAVATRCRTPSCLGIITIGQVMLIADDEDQDESAPGGQVFAGDRPRIARARLDEVLLAHPERYAAVCAAAGRMLGRVHLTETSDTLYVPVTLLVTAVAMDARGGGHCARELARALPRDDANERIRQDARALCTGQVGGGLRCGMIGRPRGSAPGPR